MQTIAFIGLGKMGAPMAANLVKVGHRVFGFDVAAAALKTATEAGVRPTASAAKAVETSEVVITMLRSGTEVLTAYREELLAAARPGTLFIDCSTIDVASAREAHALAGRSHCHSADAPVSGGVGGAAAGTLTFMVGGDEAAFAAAKPVLEAMGHRIVHCGGAGAGQAAKICNNMILGVSMIAVSEAFVLAEKLGLSHQALYDVAASSSGQCWSLTSYCPVPGPVPASPANNAYKAGFTAALMLKDLTLSQEAATAAGVETALGRHAKEIYARFDEAGRGGADFSAIIQAIRGSSGAGH